MDVVLALAAIAAGLFLLEGGAERFTAAIGALAKRMHASEGTVGLLTAGGEWEELVVVAIAMSGGHAGLAIGNVIGSCIANLIGSMPLGFLGPEPLRPDRSARVYGFVMLAVTVLAASFAAGGRVSPLAGAVLIAVFVAYLVSVLLVIRRGWLAPPEDDEDEAGAEGSLSRVALTLVVSLAVIATAAEGVVLGAVHIAEQLGLSQYAIGATVVAIGTTLPDKAISLVGGMRGQGGVVTANALGSNIFLLTLVLGLAALASGSGLAVTHGARSVDIPLLLAGSALIVGLFHRASLHWRTGATLLGLYVAYVGFVLVRG